MKYLASTACSLLLLAAVTGGANAKSSYADYNLPNLGQPADTAMTPAQSKKLGSQIITRLQAQHAIIDDPELQGFIRNIGRRLTRQTDKSPDDFHYYVIDDPSINAFALPGGYMGVNAGLIAATSNESELAGVMAHETAHVTQNHIARQAAETQGETVATLATAIVAAIIGAQMGGGDAAAAAIMGGMSHLGMQSISFTRAHEHEADRVGIRYMAGAGFDPNAMVSFFQKLQRQGDLYGINSVPQILLSHPVSSTRMAEAAARAARYPHVKVHTSPEYPYMKVRAQVLVSRSMSTTRNTFKRRLDSGHTTPANQYGYALALSKLGRYKQALKIMHAGRKQHPDIQAWQLGLAHVLSQTGQLGKAETLLSATMKQFPNSDAAKLAYARNLESQGKPSAMRSFLLSQSHLLDTYPETQEMLARGAGKQKRLGEAYYRQARYYGMLGDYPHAINQLRTALQTAHLSGYDKSRLQALRRQMVKQCHETWSNSECRRGVIQDEKY